MSDYQALKSSMSPTSLLGTLCEHRILRRERDVRGAWGGEEGDGEARVERKKKSSPVKPALISSWILCDPELLLISSWIPCDPELLWVKFRTDNTYSLRIKRSLGFLWVAMVRAGFQEVGVLWSWEVDLPLCMLRKVGRTTDRCGQCMQPGSMEGMGKCNCGRVFRTWLSLILHHFSGTIWESGERGEEGRHTEIWESFLPLEEVWCSGGDIEFGGQ